MESSFSLEHIDPRTHHLVCGLKNPYNEVIADIAYNKSKNNRFIPYRVCKYSAPITFGDLAEFLIEGEWIVCEFGGELWQKECRRVGFTSTENGHKVGLQHKLNQRGVFDPRHHGKVKEGRSKGSINGAKARRRSVRITAPSGEIFEFPSCTAAGNQLGLNLGELSKCCRGLIPAVKGYRAEFT